MYYHLASNLTARGHRPRSDRQSYSKILCKVFALSSYHDRARDKFALFESAVRHVIYPQSSISHSEAIVGYG